MALKDKQVTKNKTFFQSVGHAVDGIVRLAREERNFRIDLLMAIIVICLGFLFKLGLYDWLWLFTAFATVIGSEVMNSIIENVVDLIVRGRYDDLAKRAKDIAAGGVLLSAGFAVLVGILIFVPKFFALIR